MDAVAGAVQAGGNMWKIKIEYYDKSRLTLTGKHKDIPLRLAVKYHKEYVSGRRCRAVYQRYPKKNYPEMDLFDKIDELQMAEFGYKPEL